MAGEVVNVYFGTPPDNFCPSNPQAFVNMLGTLASGFVSGSNEPVTISFGFFLPGFCPESPTEFITELNRISRGYVDSTGERVSVSFGVPGSFCWSDPSGLVTALGQTVSARVS